MPLDESCLSCLLATTLIPAILRDLSATSAGDVESFFASRLCAQLADAKTGMWELGHTALAEAHRLEQAGIDYQEPRALA